jgi:hypothetical protein
MRSTDPVFQRIYSVANAQILYRTSVPDAVIGMNRMAIIATAFWLVTELFVK